MTVNIWNYHVNYGWRNEYGSDPCSYAVVKVYAWSAIKAWIFSGLIFTIT